VNCIARPVSGNLTNTFLALVDLALKKEAVQERRCYKNLSDILKMNSILIPYEEKKVREKQNCKE
jgi:hypothetical protein